jgi:hypothetical protein
MLVFVMHILMLTVSSMLPCGQAFLHGKAAFRSRVLLILS